jgi:hypothetical protein
MTNPQLPGLAPQVAGCINPNTRRWLMPFSVQWSHDAHNGGQAAGIAVSDSDDSQDAVHEFIEVYADFDRSNSFEVKAELLSTIERVRGLFSHGYTAQHTDYCGSCGEPITIKIQLELIPHRMIPAN